MSGEVKSGEFKTKKVAVLGATGYTGIELVRLLLEHPGAEITYLSSESHAGKSLAEVHPQFTGWDGLVCSPLDSKSVPEDVDLVFAALPHGSSVEVVPALLERGFRVVDLSADFRLKDDSLYPAWYDRAHPRADLLPSAVYGLCELRRQEIRSARLVANPGCYPTSAILGLAPLLNKGAVDTNHIVIDAKSGVSGAGRSPKQAFHFPECSESFKAYRVASHQHTPEIEQELTFMASGGASPEKSSQQGDGKPGGAEQGVTVLFTPHLIPMNRGILSTMYISLNQEWEESELLEVYRNFYADDFFVQFFEPPRLPETRWVRGTNFCHLSLRHDRRTGKAVVVSAIDNLVKGAAGQAVQNMNIMHGWPEYTGLTQTALVP